MNGSNINHVNDISWSNLIRGKHVRVISQIEIQAITIVLRLFQIIVLARARNIKFPYSAKKKYTNSSPTYSVLNPLTNSDSASAKSNGLRWVSINRIMFHETNIIIIEHLDLYQLNEEFNKNGNKNNIVRTIS
jgi:hypothetical protein